MLKIYGIKTCDSVRKAIKYLKTHEIAYQFIDFRQTPVGEKTLKTWLAHTDSATLLNTKGTTYRTLKLKEMNLNEEEKIQWLAKENMLIKRPVITFDNRVIVGYNESLYLSDINININ